jgi:vacuolar-type H+-ATPase subunit H
MSETQAGARAPDAPSAPRQVAGQATEAANQAASDVAGTAKEQARQVVEEVSTQARSVASDVRDKVTEQARTQNERLADNIRRMADDLDRMSAERGDSPAAAVVSRIASGGRQAADYLRERGPDGVLSEVQDFARRRPGAFLATALAAGFVVGRLGKGVMNASDLEPTPGTRKPADDAFVSDVPGYPSATAYPREPDYLAPATPTVPPTTASTEYVSTGTGTPVAIPDPDFPSEGRS